MVSLRQQVEGGLRICGGTVLTQTLTLTAAHCLLYGITGLHLVFGCVFFSKGGITFEATRTIIHNQFNRSTLAHDLGLVSISPAFVTFGFFIQFVKLPVDIDAFDTNTWMRIYGWGAVSDRQTFSEVLRSADLPLIDRAICDLLHDQLPDNTFCLGFFDGHIDACLGDSGGPAMVNGVQVGITSFGEGCALPMKPGVYTDLTKYLDWLQAAVDKFI